MARKPVVLLTGTNGEMGHLPAGESVMVAGRKTARIASPPF